MSSPKPEALAPVTLADIQAAESRIAPYVRKTPLLVSDYLSARSRREVLLKCEMLQRTGSFKPRGAANCILQNLPQAKKAGVVAASAGNHAQAVAMLASLLGLKATIVMPTWTPAIKIQNTQKWGAEVQLVGNVYDESFEHAMGLARTQGYLFVHPFRDPRIIAGQGTVALELLADAQFDGVEAVVVPIGGGGLATGIATVLRALKPGIKVYGVTPKNAAATWKSFHKKSVVAEDVVFTLAEGTAMKRPDESMLSLLGGLLDDVFNITEESIAHAISVLAEQGKLVVEGSGALSVAALIEELVPEKRVACILSGGNIDLPALSHILHRGLVEQGRLARLVITISDRPGGLHAATEILAKTRANILQVYHQRLTLQTAIGETQIEVDLETRGPEHTREIMEALKERGFQVTRV